MADAQCLARLGAPNTFFVYPSSTRSSINLTLKISFPQMTHQLLLIISISLLIPLLFSLFKKHKRKVPPGPKKLPIIGNLHQLGIGKLPHRSFQHLSNQYGPLMSLQLGFVHTLVVSSADVASEIFRSHDIVFSSRPVLYAAKRFSYNCCNVSFAPYSEYWKEVRKLVVLELLSAKRVQSLKAIREEEVKSMVNSIVECCSNPVNISKLALTLSNNVVCRAAFGKRGDDGKNKFYEILRETQALLGGVNLADFFPWMAWLNKFNGIESRLEKNFRELDSFFNAVIKEHLDPERCKPEHEDLVDVLLRIQADTSQSTISSDENVKGVLADMLIAGSDTSAATLVWTLAELMRNPLVKRKAQEEVREVMKGKTKVEETDLSKLRYLKLVIKESLRLHPPAPLLVPRETQESCIIGGYEIPQNTRVYINAASIATESKYWKNPYEFKPERFLDSSVDFKGQNFEFLPFGVGRRTCPGINYSVLLIEIALANLLFLFDWTLPEGMQAEDLDMEEAVGITMHKKTPLCLIASPFKDLSNWIGAN